MFQLFIKFAKTLGNVFFPHRCHCCDVYTDFGVIICPKCKSRLLDVIGEPRIVTDTRFKYRIFSLSPYDSFAADIIKIIKYRPSLKLVNVLAQVCKSKSNLHLFLKPDDIIVPIPMHKKRLKERGFNQAEEIAKAFSKIGGCHFSTVAVRSVFTKPQASCTETERLKNTKGSFKIDPDADPAAFHGHRIILVDDVATTGSTLQQCADELAKLKPAEIIALTVAHSYKKS